MPDEVKYIKIPPSQLRPGGLSYFEGGNGTTLADRRIVSIYLLAFIPPTDASMKMCALAFGSIQVIVFFLRTVFKAMLGASSEGYG